MKLIKLDVASVSVVGGESHEMNQDDFSVILNGNVTSSTGSLLFLGHGTNIKTFKLQSQHCKHCC